MHSFVITEKDYISRNIFIRFKCWTCFFNF